MLRVCLRLTIHISVLFILLYCDKTLHILAEMIFQISEKYELHIYTTRKLHTRTSAHNSLLVTLC
jgi:hypothetical protein